MRRSGRRRIRGDYILIEWAGSVPYPVRHVLPRAGELEIREPNFEPEPRNEARVWNSAGAEIAFWLSPRSLAEAAVSWN